MVGDLTDDDLTEIDGKREQLVGTLQKRYMGILAWIVVGLVAGWLAGMVMKGGGYGVVGDIIIGIVGALVGGFLASTLFGAQDAVNGINLTSIIVAFLGAVVAIAAIRALPGRSPV